jgi:tetratricopeptide (TPR) repeat protein
MSYRIAKRASAFATSLVALVSYLLTMPPSVAFWRPAELAAAASVFGVPEPTAPSFWLLLARIARLVLPGDAASSTALLSALCSAATAGLVVLIVSALVERWFDDETAHGRVALPAIGAGVVAGLAFAWGDSQWRAATVTSSEPLAVLLVATALWLTLAWSRRADEPGSGRLLLAAALALGLLAGVDPRLVVIAPALGAMVFLRAVRVTAASLVAAIAIAIVGGWLFDRLVTTWLPSLLDGSNWFLIIAVPVLLAIVLTAWRAASDDERPSGVGLAAAACALALIGATTVLVLPIRGAAAPAENAYAPEREEPVAHLVGVDAESDAPFWPRRWSLDPERRRYQDRYGDWSPAALENPTDASIGGELRFFWSYQLSHMYMRYLLWNFVGRSNDGADAPPAWFAGGGFPQETQPSVALENVFPIRFYALPLLLALIGFAAHVRRDPRMAGALALLFLLTSVGIVVAVSLQQPQSRERDALYLASFLVVAIWIGVGAASLAAGRSRDDEHEESGPAAAGVGVVALLLCAAAAPVNMLVGGWGMHDRGEPTSHADGAGTTVAWDYAYNLLASCDSNAILLTAGDNDTFPLLYVQDAGGVRRDVRVVNIRMANDPAYLRRVSREYRWDAAPLGLALVDSLDRRLATTEVQVGTAPTIVIDAPADSVRGRADTSTATMRWVLRGPAVAGEGIQAIRLQERAIVDLLRQNRWRRPVYFAAGVPASERAGLDQYLRREGLALHVMPRRQEAYAGEAVDTAFLRAALFGAASSVRAFRLDGFTNARTYLDPEERRIVSLYRHLFLVLAEQESSGRFGAAAVRSILDGMERRIPSSVHPMPYWMSAAIASLYWRAGDRREAQRAAQRAVEAVDALGQDWRKHPHARVYNPIQIKAQMLALLDDYDRAIETYKGLQSKYPNDAHLRGQLEELRVERYLSRRDTAGALAEIDRIVAGYSSVSDPGLLNNAAAFRDLAEELRGRRP